MQFYIVQAGPVPDSIIDKSEGRINEWLANHYTLHAPENKVWLDSLNMAMANENWQATRVITDTIAKLSENFADFEPYKIPDEHRTVYRTIGGTPMLDQNYTVFAEVVSGMEVVDSIAAVRTNPLDRPVEDVRILTARVLEKQE
jgi:cyclophilin family peptidyl-prolyl cis-trans isomerase